MYLISTFHLFVVAFSGPGNNHFPIFKSLKSRRKVLRGEKSSPYYNEAHPYLYFFNRSVMNSICAFYFPLQLSHKIIVTN